MMSTATLESLPTEALNEICSYLDPVGLQSLSVSGKTCRAGAIPLRFRTIRIKTSGLSELQTNVEALLEIFADPSKSRHVRRLELLSTFAPGRWKRWQYWPDGIAPATAQSYDGWWLSFAKLLALLTGLTDFVYASSMQISPCVLEALSQKSVRLHMDTFQLRSLLKVPQDPFSIDPFELRMATCSNLHSLALRFDKVESSGTHNFNEEAVRDMVTGAAPNLKEVSILREYGGSSPWLLQAWRQPRSAWKGLELGRNPIKTFGRLTLLELAGPNVVELQSMIAWSKITNFSMLRTLKLLTSVKTDTITWMSANTQMRSLRVLALDLCSLAPGDPLDPGHDALQTATALFLRTLPPLRSVRLTGDLSEYIVKETCRKHGHTLQQLLIPGDNRNGDDEEFILEHHLLEKIAKSCPQLEEISVPLTRTHGDKKEIALYQCLGSMPRLRDIQLSLHCYKRASHLGIERLSDWERRPFHSRDGEEDVLNLDVRRLLINYAIDSDLARSIFRTISMSKPAWNCALERVELLMPETSHSLNNSPFDSVVWDAVTCVGRQWECRVKPRDDALHECTTKEINSEECEDIEEEAEFHENVVEVWRSIWPAVEGKRNNWKSLPLEKI